MLLVPQQVVYYVDNAPPDPNCSENTKAEDAAVERIPDFVPFVNAMARKAAPRIPHIRNLANLLNNFNCL